MAHHKVMCHFSEVQMYTLLIVLIYMAFISLGLPDSLLGSAWPVMHQDIGVSISFMGILSMIISGGTIISSLMSDKITKKLGTNKVTTISVFLTAIALMGFSYAKNIWWLIAFAIPYGLGAGSIDAALNNYVAIHYSSKHMSWLHCFWGVGTIISPFIMSYSLTNYSWNNGYSIVSIIQLIIGIILLLTLPIWKVNSVSKAQEEIQPESLSFITALKIKGVPSLLIGFFAYCAAECTAMSWSCTYLVNARGIDEPTAAAFASMFFIGMTVGRFIAGFFMDTLGDKRMIVLGASIIGIGLILMMIPNTDSLFSLIGLIVIGLGCAPIYPCIIHATPNNFGPEKSGAIIGIQMASAYCGATFIPPIFGLISEFVGFELFPVYMAVFFILMLIMVIRTFNLTTKE